MTPPASRLHPHVAFVVAFTVPVLAAVPARAATESQIVEQGKSLYDNGKYKEAIEWFQQAIEGSPPTVINPAQVMRGRMYAGASYMALQDYGKADQQFERLLRLDMKFQPEAFAFPPGVVDELNRVRKKLEKEDADKAAAAAAKAQIDALQFRLDNANKLIADLRVYAGTERVVIKNSRVLASLPFGIGQFQNGDPSWGLFFAGVEVVSTITAGVSFYYHRSNPAPGEELRTLVTNARYINTASVIVFGLSAIAGIIQAHVAFVPEKWETRKRPLPPNLAWSPMLAPTENKGVVLGATGTF